MTNRIKQLRVEINMTQVCLSIELEVSQETISAYENKKHYPHVATLLKLSEIFHASCDYILGLSKVRYTHTNTRLTLEESQLVNKGKSLDNRRKNYSAPQLGIYNDFTISLADFGL
jgi:DNA-binding XRE family transcriptional regulator